MDPVRHPIAMFVVTVLAVIGVGVGVVAATAHPKVYGPPWGRFSAAFSGRVYEYHGYGAVSVTGAPQDLTPFSSSATLRFPVLNYSTASRQWIGYAHLSNGVYVTPSDLEAVSVQGAVPTAFIAVQSRLYAATTALFSAGVPEVTQDSNGFSVTTVGPQCAYGECRVVKLVSNGRVVWEVLALSRGSMSPVGDFLGSFQPIG